MTHDDADSIAALDALGLAGATDAGALRLHVAGCLPCRRARVEYGEAAALIARSLAPLPPPRALRHQIIAAARGEERSSTARWLATAAALFVVLWGSREVALRNSAQREAAQLVRIAELREEKATLVRRNDKLTAEIAALTAAGTRTIALSGQEIAPRASAKVFLEPDRRRAVVFFSDLPATPGDKSYQLWILRADQPNPMSAGVFDVNDSGRASISIENLPVATEIKGLAVTLEPRGGVDQPTNTRFYVAGST